jgi:hypothetical protein
LNSVPIIGSIGGVYLNFSLWAIAILPAWFVIKEIGVTLGDGKFSREAAENKVEQSSQNEEHSSESN